MSKSIIKIDREFLDMMLQKQADIEKRVNELAKTRTPEAKEAVIRRFPLEARGVMLHDRIPPDKQKEFFVELAQLMINFRIRKVNVKLDFRF